MVQPHPSSVPSFDSFVIVPARAARGLERDVTRRFMFRVPPRWRSPILENPFAREAQSHVIEWLESLGCTRAEVDRARRFDVAGYVGLPFPTLSRAQTLRIAKHLTLWLLWDDVQVETLDNRWRIDAPDALARRRPDGMTRFDEGWWQVMGEFAAARSPRWVEDVCQAMSAWCAAAVEEAIAMRDYRERGVYPTFDRQMEMRRATIGMSATVYLLEDAYDFELPRSFHAHPTVARLTALANEIVGLGNDILSFAKDCSEHQLNLASTLMHERGLTVDEALERLVRMHDEALEEYDRLADSLDGWPAETAPFIARWLQDVRYASLGFSLWESQAPRYTAYKVVAGGRLVEPRFSFFPPRSEPPSSRRLDAAPGSRRFDGAPGSVRFDGVPGSRRFDGPPSSRRGELPPSSRRVELPMRES